MPLSWFSSTPSIQLPSTGQYNPAVSPSGSRGGKILGGYRSGSGGSTPVESDYSQFSSIFKPPAELDPNKVAQDVQKLLINNKPGAVTAPTAAYSDITLPGGTYNELRDSLYNSQFNPVERELERQRGVQDTALSGELAQAGLAESGAGIAQRSALGREFGQREEDASRDISASATATALNAEIGVSIANAQLHQQVNLANAGFSLTAQVESARNLLNRNDTAAQAYLAALGINASQASAYRNSFLSFFGTEEQSRLTKSKLAQDAAATMLNYNLQQRSLDLQQYNYQTSVDLHTKALALQEQANANQFAAGMSRISSGGGSPSNPRQQAISNATGGQATGSTPPPAITPTGTSDAALARQFTGGTPDTHPQSYTSPGVPYFNPGVPVESGTGDGSGFFAPPPVVSDTITGAE